MQKYIFRLTILFDQNTIWSNFRKSHLIYKERKFFNISQKNYETKRFYINSL